MTAAVATRAGAATVARALPLLLAAALVLTAIAYPLTSGAARDT